VSRALIVLALLLTVAPARAGDRRLEVLLVNMTPDALSSAASKTCVREIEAHLKADYTTVGRLGESAVRKLVKKTAGEPFMEWPAGAIKPAKERGATSFDAAVLIDCRPETQHLDVLVIPASAGRARLTLRAAIDAATTTWIGDAILRRAWSGFMV
jgi:hypothetical protein